jgi:hypothetical protein
MTYRKGELSPAMIDRGWPHQVGLPASACEHGGYKLSTPSARDCRFARVAIRFSMKASGSTSTALPSRSDWNKPPTEPMLVAIRSVDGERVRKTMKWALIPH